MKRILFALTLIAATLTANAQTDIELLGTWNITGSWGDFKFNKGTIKAFQFADGNYTKITFSDGTQTVDWIFKGYWLSTTTANDCFLHLLPWNSDESIVNFKIQDFEGDAMTLTTYDGKGTIILTKDTSAGVNAARTEAPTGKAYGLNGTELPTPDAAKVIVIQDGKKIIK